jgi:transcriptional regulator with XRE-family HTH domain
MHHQLPCYLHSLRKRYGLSQPELAELLGISVSALSRYEGQSRKPTAELIVAAEVIFGLCAKDIFPLFYHEVQQVVVKRAKALYARLEKHTEPAAYEKLRLLDALFERANQDGLGL